MILICDLGLGLMKQFTILEKSTEKDDFIADSSLSKPMGEGCNLSRVLLSFGESHSLLGFAGTLAHAEIMDRLGDDLINLNLIPIKDRSSEAIYINFLDKKIRIQDKQAKLTREEIVNFYADYKEGLNLNELVCLVGEHPLNIPEDMVFNIVDLSAKWGRKMLLAVKDKSFLNALDAVPYTLILSKKVLEDITNLSLDFENEIIKACRYLFDKGIKHIIIDNTENGLIILNEEYGYRLSVAFEDKDRRLSYAGVLGGFALSINRRYDMETLCKLSYACGLVNFEYFDMEFGATDIKALMKTIELTRFNNI